MPCPCRCVAAALSHRMRGKEQHPFATAGAPREGGELQRLRDIHADARAQWLQAMILTRKQYTSALVLRGLRA